MYSHLQCTLPNIVFSQPHTKKLQKELSFPKKHIIIITKHNIQNQLNRKTLFFNIPSSQENLSSCSTKSRAGDLSKLQTSSLSQFWLSSGGKKRGSGHSQPHYNKTHQKSLLKKLVPFTFNTYI